MPVDPLQLQQQENLGAPTPSPIRPDLGAAEVAGQKIEAFEEQDKFKALLEGGVEAMAATRQRLIQEGVINETDLQDPTQFPEFQQPQNGELRLKWWQELSSKIQRSKNMSNIKSGLSKDTHEDRSRALGESGLITPESSLNAINESEMNTKAEEMLKTIRGKRKGATGSEDEDEADLTYESEVLNALELMPETSHKKTAISNTKTQIKIIQDRIKQKNINERAQKRLAQSADQFATKEGRLQSQFKIKNIKDYAKYSSEAREIGVGMDSVNKALKGMGLPNGIFTEDPKGVDIPKSGFFGDKFSRFVKSKEGIEFVSSINRVIAKDRHSLFGATLTTGEADAFKSLTGAKFLSNQKQLLGYLRKISDRVEENLKTESTIASQAGEQGLMTSKLYHDMIYGKPDDTTKTAKDKESKKLDEDIF